MCYFSTPIDGLEFGIRIISTFPPWLTMERVQALHRKWCDVSFFYIILCTVFIPLSLYKLKSRSILMWLIFVYRLPKCLMMRGLCRPFRVLQSSALLCVTPRALQTASTWMASQSPSLRRPRDRLALQSKYLEKAWWGKKSQLKRCFNED